MPEYGARFRGDNSVIQIDTSFRNFEVLASGSGAGTDTFFSRVDISFPACPEPPMLFLKTDNNTSGSVAFQNWNKTGSNYTGARIIVFFGYLQFSWFVVSPPLTKSQDAWGVRIYDESTKLVFDGGKRYLKIVDAIRLGVSDGFGGQKFSSGMGEVVGHSSVSSPYYCLGGGNAHLMDEEQQTSTYMTLRSIDSVSVSFSLLTANINPGAYSTYASESFKRTGKDWIYQCPVIVGVLTN